MRFEENDPILILSEAYPDKKREKGNGFFPFPAFSVKEVGLYTHTTTTSISCLD